MTFVSQLDVRGTPGLLTAANLMRIVGNGVPYAIVVPAAGGAALADGQNFIVSDGGNSPTTFEFNSIGGVAPGRIAVPFTAASTAAQVAVSIASAINGVAGTLLVSATARDGNVDLTGLSDLNLTNSPSLQRGNATPYLIGRDNSGNPLADGTSFNVPQGVTVMIDSGAVFKLQGAIVDVGTSSVNVNRSQAALQVLGVRGLPDLPSLPQDSVYFTSFHDDGLGGNSDGVSTGPAPGHWGGLVFRQDSDRDPQTVNVSRGVFLNTVSNADLRWGGGQVTVNSQLQVFDPIHLETERPTIAFNSITFSADSAISGDPNSFEETRFGGEIPDRVGPKIHGNRLTGNSINGVFLRVRTNLGSPVDRLDVSARLDDTDVVYVVTENLHINGNPGGSQAVNESQRVTVTGTPTGGTFTLTVAGQTTAPIAFNAPVSTGANETQRVGLRYWPFISRLKSRLKAVERLISLIQVRHQFVDR
jgi:hypothetical protein